MQEIRIHGRGGQGVVTASELIAISAFYKDNYTQAFPSFGVERTGAPIESYARINNKFIRTREQIYNPDVLIILDASLLDTAILTKGCNKNTKIIINTSKNIKTIKKELKDKQNISLPEKNIIVLDATKIGLKILKKNLANTVILGALAKKTDLITLDSLKKAIKQKFANKNKGIINKNLQAITKAYNQ